jgi:3-deoxy-D-manno-octulosonic-acid transferase
LFRSFELCLARSRDDAERFETLGIADIRCVGDLKNAAPPLPADLAELERLRSTIGGRPIWLAASTHPGEERAISAAHDLIKTNHPDLLTIITPRHPERGGDVRDELRPTGDALAQRSAGEEPGRGIGLYLADTLGELGLFYRLARIAFIGGSLVPHGGQNPLEAARLGCPPIFGPHTDNFETMTASLIDVGAARRVQDVDDLALTVSTLLSDPVALDHMVALSKEAGLAEEAVLDRMLDAILPLLDRQIGLSPQTIEAIDARA